MSNCPECKKPTVYGPTTGQETCLTVGCAREGWTWWPNGKMMPPPLPGLMIGVAQHIRSMPCPECERLREERDSLQRCFARSQDHLTRRTEERDAALAERDRWRETAKSAEGEADRQRERANLAEIERGSALAERDEARKGLEEQAASRARLYAVIASANERADAALATAQARDEEAGRLRNAIVEHRSQKADDRCIEDDDRLYAALGDGIKCDRRVGDKAAMLENCRRFIERRCEGGHWPSYAELEAALRETIKDVSRSWSFDDGQRHTHSWHDREDCLDRCRARIDAALGSPR